jgi:glutamate formiminotransferase
MLECVPNFSEGRRPEVIEAIVAALTGVPGVALLDHEMDAAHNRAVVTIAGEAGAVAEAAFRGAREARDRIDLNAHQGEHPRMGAMDVCPFVPLEGATMDLAVTTARGVGRRIGEELSVPVFLYERAATRPERVNLADVRKGQFEGLRELIGKDPARDPDFGPKHVHPTAGAVAVGARTFLIAYNVNLKSPDVAIAKAIAKKVRERDGGLPKVKALGFFLEDRDVAQVSMNLTDFTVTPIRAAFDAVAAAAAAAGVEVLESELVGLTPRAALDRETAEHIHLAGFDPKTQVIEDLLEARSKGRGSGQG